MDRFFDMENIGDVYMKEKYKWDRNSFDIKETKRMFFFKLKDGRLINMDHIVLITPSMVTTDAANLTMNSGLIIFLNEEEWADLSVLIDSYLYKEIE